MCQPIVNMYPAPSNAVTSMYIAQSWGAPFVEKKMTLQVPAWIAAAGNIKLDDPTIWQDRNGKQSKHAPISQLAG